MPAAPTTVTSRHGRSATALAKAPRSMRSSSRAADERRVEAARVRRARPRSRRARSRRRPAPLFPLTVELVARLEHRRVRDEPAGRVADQDLAGARRLLESLRNVDGVARHEHLSAGAVAGDDLAGVDADRMPMRTPSSRSSSSLSGASASRSSVAARTARSASSSCSSGSRRRPSPRRRCTSPPCRRGARAPRTSARTSAT